MNRRDGRGSESGRGREGEEKGKWERKGEKGGGGKEREATPTSSLYTCWSPLQVSLTLHNLVFLLQHLLLLQLPHPYQTFVIEKGYINTALGLSTILAYL